MRITTLIVLHVCTETSAKRGPGAWWVGDYPRLRIPGAGTDISDAHGRLQSSAHSTCMQVGKNRYLAYFEPVRTRSQRVESK